MKRFLLVIMFLGIMRAAFVCADDAQPKPFVYDDHGKRDPMWYLVNTGGVVMDYSSEIVLSDLFLEGIMTSPDGKNVAILNGRLLRLNEKIGQFTIVEIGKDSIVLMDGQQRFELKLKKEE